MGYVNLSLMNCGDLSTMASPGAGAAGHLPQALPNAGGLYVIFNVANDNRYVGTAGDLVARFTGRMLVVNELGLSQADLQGTPNAQANNGLYVFWGLAQAYHSPLIPPQNRFNPRGSPLANGFYVAQVGMGPAVPVPNNFYGGQAPLPNYNAVPVTTTIDGVQVNVEALLIRLFRVAGFGGTMTNAQYMGLFQNPTTNDLIVQLEWGTIGNVVAGYICITIPANSAF